MYLSILCVTDPILACNNRDEGHGNVQTLHKIQTVEGARTYLSGYAIKWQVRAILAANGSEVWRHVLPEYDPEIPAGYVYGPNKSPCMTGAPPESASVYDDTELFGFMIADGDSDSGETESSVAVVPETKGKGKKAEPKAKGKVDKRRSAVDITDAISTSIWDGDQSFSQGLKAAESKLNPFMTQQHYTRYQYVVSVNLSRLTRPGLLERFLNTLLCLQVGGNQASHATELTPSIWAWRLHKTPGLGGLYQGVGMNADAHVPVDLTPLFNKLTNLGLTCQVAGQGQKTTIVQAIADILDAVESK